MINRWYLYLSITGWQIFTDKEDDIAEIRSYLPGRFLLINLFTSLCLYFAVLINHF